MTRILQLGQNIRNMLLRNLNFSRKITHLEVSTVFTPREIVVGFRKIIRVLIIIIRGSENVTRNSKKFEEEY